MALTPTTWDPAHKAAGVTLSSGNLVAASLTSTAAVKGVWGVSAGKWYWETRSAQTFVMSGIGNAAAVVSGTGANPGATTDGRGLAFTNGGKQDGSFSAYASAPATNSWVGHVLDMDAGTLSYIINGADAGVAFSGLTGTWYPMVGGVSGTSVTVTANFGATAFANTVPAGFVAGIGDGVGVGEVTGFSSTAFGTPHAVYNQTGTATGLQSTAFGTPVRLLSASAISPTTAFGTPVVKPIAVGFRSTRFGIPSIPLIATGFASGAFGAALGFQHWRAIALGPTARFGTPTTPTDRTQVAGGFSSTRLGVPVAVRIVPALSAQQGLASGRRTTAFGHPTVAASFSGDATGFNSTAFGTPASAISERATASSVDSQTALGTPTARISMRASGMRGTGFGTPGVRLTQPAASTHRATRFGLPTCVRSNTYLARALGPTSRMGHPRAFNRFNYPVTSIAPTTAFGTPAAVQGHRVTAIAPGTRFGAPLLQRNPLC